ncbi:cysteine-rich CWC family protein [Haliea sp. E17]|uniref:cysteine-rich CWC family protein n=1 Tax=Haliea sp. E17 TaxID=3401576 RepID=UPI003AAA67D5
MSDLQKNSSRPSAERCPLCAAANRCAIAAGEPAESCWCFSSPVSREALGRLPGEERMARCICPDCAGVTEGL